MPNVLAFVTSPTSLTAGVPFSVTVQARDNAGNVLSCFTSNVTVSLGSNPGGASLTGTTTVAANAGVATFSNLSINKTAAGYTLNATATGVSAGSSTPFTVQPGQATKLAVTFQPPLTVTAGQVISPPIVVTAQDASGNTATNFSNPVTLTITSGTGSAGAALTGTTTLAANSGVATFFDLKIDKSGAGYTLSAVAAGLTGAATNGFSVVAGPVDHLAFIVPPTGVAAGATIAPAVLVAAQDVGGNTVTSFTGSVTLVITSGTGTAGAALTGTTTATVANGRVASGVATFNDLKINLAGNNYTLTATSGTVTAATSAPFTISVGAVDHLAFTAQPTSTTAATTIAPPIQVTAQDLGGNTVTSFTGSVTVAITAGTGTAGAALTGTTTATVANGRVVNGVATFNDLKIDLAGSNYTLTATATGATAATSFTFNITIGVADHFAFTVQPNSTTGGAIINNAQGGVKVTAQDAANNTVTGFSGSVTIALVTGPGATGALTGTTIATVANGRLVNGVATFNDLKVDKSGTGYKLLATATGVTAGLSSAFDIAVGPLDHLAFTAQPNNATSTVTIAPPVQVTAQDAGNNTVTGFGGTVTVAITAGTGTAGALISGGASVQATASSGVATFSTLSIDKVGTNYTLTATATGATAGTSAPFNISIGAATRFAFSVQPTSAIAGQNLSPSVQVAAQDAGGNTVPTFTGPVTVAITAGTGTAGAKLSGGASVTVPAATSGVATFQGAQALSIDKAGTNYQLTASGALTSATSAQFTISVGGLSQFAFTAQPISTVAGVAITSQGGGTVQVTAQDAAGNALTSFTGQVTMSLGTNPVGGTLTGTMVKNALSGVATFSDLKIDLASPGYQLLATSGTASGLSQAFAITAAAGNHLAFTAQPTNTTAGANINNPTGVVVTAQDGNNNTDPTFTGNVTMAITAGSGTAGALLSGGATVTVQAQNGVATFPALTINKSGINYSLTATATGLTGAQSAAFNINAGAPSQLVFTAEPTTTVSAATINNPSGVVVTVQDALGNTATTFVGDVTVALTVAGGATLSGTTTATVANARQVNGVATFNDLKIDKVGSYTLTASINAGAITKASATFDITHGAAAQLVFTVQPAASTVAGVNMVGATGPNVVVTVQDAAGNTVLGFTGPVTVQITGGSGTANAHLSGGASVQVPNANQGVATFTGAQALSIDSANVYGPPSTPNPYTLTANINSGAITKGSAPFNITAGTATKLAFTVQPAASTVAGVNLPGATAPSVIVRAQDALGNTVPGYATNVTLATTGPVAPLFGTNCAAGSCTASTANGKLVNGIATFDNFNIHLAGTGYTLAGTSGALTPATSAAFNITADVVTQLGFITQPTNTRANHTIDSLPAPGVQVAAQDQFGNTNPTWPNSVTLTISTDPGIGGSNLSGGTTASTGNGKLANGVATFNDLKINKGGAGFVLQAASGSLSPVLSQPFSILALYAVNRGSNAITIYAAEATGNAAPTAVIQGANTGLNQPYAAGFDAQGNVYISSNINNTVQVFAAGATGNVSPIRTISGANTGMNSPTGVAVDGSGNLYVSNFFGNSITVYVPGATGNATPIRTITGASTGLNNPFRIAVDGTGNLYVANFGANSITVYGPGATGNVAPTRTITGASTGLNAPAALALDGIGNLYVLNPGNSSVTVYAPNSNGNVAPTSTLSGASTGLNTPTGIAFFGGNIYVSNFGNNSITVYAAGSNGNVPPSAVIQGAATLLNQVEDNVF